VPPAEPIQAAPDIEALQAAQNGLDNLYKKAWMLKQTNEKATEGMFLEYDKNSEKKIIEALNDDLGLPQALAIIQKTINTYELSFQSLLTIDEKILGLKISEGVKKEEKLFKEVISDSHLDELIERRKQARKNKDYQESDSLRKEIESLGYFLKDKPDGTQEVTKK
jgi:cysteinyl-tRNA synthetase